MKHVVYMENGNIFNSFTGNVIRRPAILVSREADVIHGWGDAEDVEAKFKRFAYGYSQAKMAEELNDLMFIELSEFSITSEMACYVICRAVEYTASSFIPKLCSKITDGSDFVSWLKSEMERVPV